METTIDKANSVYKALLVAKLGKMKNEDKFTLIKNMKVLKPIATDYDDFFQNAMDKLKPEGFENIASKLNKGENISKEEHQILSKYDREVMLCVQEELKKTIDVTLNKIEEDSLQELVAVNNFTMSEIMNISELMGE